MIVDIQVIDHKDHRKNIGETCGDWWFDLEVSTEKATGLLWPHSLHVRVSKLGNSLMEQLVAHHEYTEAMWCYAHEVPGQEVDLFDRHYHPQDDYDEPGDSSEAPYYKGHQIATAFERILATEFHIDWRDYEETIAKLFR